jgi:hypothetical protein
VVFAAEAVVLATTIWLILNTLLDDAALGSRTTAVATDGVRYVVTPLMTVTLTMLGFAMMLP